MATLSSLNPNNAAVHAVLGGAGTGKTQMLIEHVDSLLKEGATSNEIIVLAATHDAAYVLKNRLAGLAGPTSRDVRVESVREFALTLLASDEARAFTGRDPRLLAPFEMNVLMEDIKTTGLRPNRLREMLKFFCKSWTELSDDDPDWIISQEEAVVVEAIKGSLSLSRGILEQEVSNFAVHYLRAHDDALAANAYKYVLADDYQTLSFASQTLVGMIASGQLWIAGDPCMQGEAFDSYPRVESLSQLAEAEGVSTLRLEASHRASAAVTAAKALLDSDCFADATKIETSVDADPSESALSVLSFRTPEEELRGAADEVVRLIESGVVPGDIFVAAPNKSWVRNMRAALVRKGVAVDAAPSAQSLSGDIRDASRCTAPLVLSALALTAQPDNALALRSWCGFGDYLASSPLFEHMRAMHAKSGKTLSQLLDELGDSEDAIDDEPVCNIRRTLDAYAAAQSIAARANSLRGGELLQTLTRDVTGNEIAIVPAVILQLCDPIHEDADAEELFANAVSKLNLPRFEHNPNSVKLGLYENASGLNPQAIVLTGFVNGFFPNLDYFEDTKFNVNQRNSMLAADIKRLYGLVGKANRSICITYFTEASPEAAGALKLKVDRVRMREGKRVCSVSPSLLLHTITGK